MEDYIGTIQAFAFGWAPQEWLACQGQQLPIASYQALYSLIGITYGGNGSNTFNLPDLRGRSLIGMGNLDGTGTAYPIGDKRGSESVMLTAANLPAHNHSLATSAGATTNLSVAITTSNSNDNTTESGVGTNALGTGESMLDVYRESNNKAGAVGGVEATLSGNTAPAGTGAPFNNRDPYLVTNYCICVNGYYPSRP